jgi:G3E family GTPase
MMRILLISGFLGSGKTTLTLELAREAAGQGKKVALLINEVGEIGIDPDLFPDRAETEVFELFSGCVCCQTGDDLIKALKAVSESGKTDLVAVEPSGVAQPSQIIDTIRCWDDAVPIFNVVLIDASRFLTLWDQLEHLIGDALLSADLLVISKVDLCGPDELETVRNKLKDLCPAVPAIAANLNERASAVSREVLAKIV